MKTALVISSFVSASHVGATTSAFCLRRLGIETIILPTTLFGRHPGWGAPGGRITPPELLRDMWSGIEAQNITFDAVLTGYMSHPDHIALAKEIITTLKTQNPQLSVLVDPVMGDHGKLYVSAEIADHIQTALLPLASVTTPNLWELHYMSGTSHNQIDKIADCALTHLPCPSVITSMPIPSKIGALYLDNVNQTPPIWVAHKKFESVPNGGGDMIAGLFLAHSLNAEPPPRALSRSVSSVFHIMEFAQQENHAELPLIQCQDALIDAAPLSIHILT